MSNQMYLVTGICYEPNTTPGPAEFKVAIPSWVWGAGPEDFEPEGVIEALEDLAEEEGFEMWDDYEPSEEAHEAFDKMFNEELMILLKKYCPGDPISYAWCEPVDT